MDDLATFVEQRARHRRAGFIASFANGDRAAGSFPFADSKVGVLIPEFGEPAQDNGLVVFC